MVILFTTPIGSPLLSRARGRRSALLGSRRHADRLLAMSGIVVAAAAFLLYVWEQHAGILVVVLVATASLVALALAVLAGVYLGHDTPAATRWLLGLWSVGVVAGAGAVAAVIADISTGIVAGESATDATKTTSALAAAALVAIATQANSWLPKHLSPWLARKVVWSRYAATHFPCLPADMPKGAAAWEQLTEAHKAGVDAWKGPKVQALLATIKDAVSHKQTAKDAGWKCA